MRLGRDICWDSYISRKGDNGGELPREADTAVTWSTRPVSMGRNRDEECWGKRDGRILNRVLWESLSEKVM